MKTTNRQLFEEEYRVVAVESERLTIRGVQSGEVLTIVTGEAGAPLNMAEYPLGQLIALRDPMNVPGN